MKDRLRILLADDHTIVRQGLAKVLEAEPGFRVVGEARDGREAISQVEQFKPDIVIMDITMPMLKRNRGHQANQEGQPQYKNHHPLHAFP